MFQSCTLHTSRPDVQEHPYGQPQRRDSNVPASLSVRSIGVNHKPGNLVTYFGAVKYAFCNILDGCRHFYLREPMSNTRINKRIRTWKDIVASLTL